MFHAHAHAHAHAYILVLCAASFACVATPDSPVSTSESSSGTTESSSGATETGASTSTETGASTSTETGTETGEMCTGETCNSTLILTLNHSLPLLEGPHRVQIQTLTHEINCSVEASEAGSKSCFGFAFGDLSWDSEQITVVLTHPFYDTVENPEALPFESIMVEVERGNEILLTAEVPVDGGEPVQPDPCGPTCWQAVASVTIE